MSKKKMLFGMWLMSMTILSLTAYSMYFIAQIKLSILMYSYSALAISQVCATIVYLVGSEKIKNGIVRFLYHLCCLASLAVIPALIFITMGLVSQYHAVIPEAVYIPEEQYASIVPGDTTTVYKTDMVYVFFPEYSCVDFESKVRPDKKDDSITWCSGAAFQHEVLLDFVEDNIEGYHASRGVFYDNPYINKDSAAFVYWDNHFGFEFDDPKSAIETAAEQGGSGFMQLALIRDGEIVSAYAMPRVRSYRALAELNGALCIIDTIEMTYFDDFLNAMQQMGVKNALYMDMGAGWNYSWYRKESGTVKDLFGFKVPWSHNWIVFRK